MLPTKARGCRGGCSGYAMAAAPLSHSWICGARCWRYCLLFFFRSRENGNAIGEVAKCKYSHSKKSAARRARRERKSARSFVPRSGLRGCLLRPASPCNRHFKHGRPARWHVPMPTAAPRCLTRPHGARSLPRLPSWGIAWWINDLLIPEIYVERGQTYYFTVYGGNDKLNSPTYHPLYITNSPEGAGGLCEWRHEGLDAWEDSITFEEYKETLYKDCDAEPPGSLIWTCYTHRNLGWKIHVVDSGYNLRQEGISSGPTLTPLHTHLATLAALLLPALMLPLR
ncbi:hypothetical protein C7M84_003770 [Penaeus vannamei]|uniref:Uncharacterized protein n=1 Tax=Penaeus vannamei TaxID=6689 RepID=A0A423TMA0_PENVA|nr:hypothetical protein C7M84_003770 [Penaeus vannamei]